MPSLYICNMWSLHPNMSHYNNCLCLIFQLCTFSEQGIFPKCCFPVVVARSCKPWAFSYQDVWWGSEEPFIKHFPIMLATVAKEAVNLIFLVQIHYDRGLFLNLIVPCGNEEKKTGMELHEHPHQKLCMWCVLLLSIFYTVHLQLNFT